MANVIRIKRSAVQGKVPSTGDLQLGELAINTFDGKLYTKKDNGDPSVVRIGGFTDNALTFNSGGSGDPSGTTFDGNSSKTISYNTLGAPSATGSGASGTWGIGISGNAATASTLQTSRTLWGQSFNGGANVSGNLTSVGNITGTGAVTLTATNGALNLAATGANPVSISTGGVVRLHTTDSGNVGVGTLTPGHKLEVVGSFAATTKSFVIPHPTKKNLKLRYGSLEGPENGVYVRGRSQDKVINLPDYWSKLVDSSSITVNLTPIGDSATPRVKKITRSRVTVFTKEEGELDYYYTVFAERKDVEKLEVEF